MFDFTPFVHSIFHLMSSIFIALFTFFSVAPSSPGYSESSVDNIFEAKLKDVMDSHASLKETVDKAVVKYLHFMCISI